MTDLRWPSATSGTGSAEPLVPALERLLGATGLTLPRLRWIVILVAIAAASAPVAHLLEMPNKLGLDGGLWLVTQLTLYKGWNWIFGPLHVMAMTGCGVIAACRAVNPAALAATVAAVLAYAAMLGVFFAVLHPIDVEIGHWEPITLPLEWPQYRLRWELAQATQAMLSVMAVGAQLQAWKMDRGR